MTNAHVVHEYRLKVQIHKRATFMLPNQPLDLDARLLDMDDGSDLATIDLADLALPPREVVRTALQPRSFFCPPVWPPQPVNEGEIVSFAGWPGSLRKDEPDNRGAEFNPYSFTDVAVTLAMQDRFRIKLDRDTASYSFGRTKADEDEKDFDLGGMSGSPVIRRTRDNYEIVGIVVEYSGRSEEFGILFDIFVMTNAENVKRDGTLWHNTRR